MAKRMGRLWCRLLHGRWHQFGSPEWSVRDGREYERLSCRCCGNVSESWRPM